MNDELTKKEESTSLVLTKKEEATFFKLKKMVSYIESIVPDPGKEFKTSDVFNFRNCLRPEYKGKNVDLTLNFGISAEYGPQIFKKFNFLITVTHFTSKWADLKITDDNIREMIISNRKPSVKKINKNVIDVPAENTNEAEKLTPKPVATEVIKEHIDSFIDKMTPALLNQDLDGNNETELLRKLVIELRQFRQEVTTTIKDSLSEFKLLNETMHSRSFIKNK